MLRRPAGPEPTPAALHRRRHAELFASWGTALVNVLPTSQESTGTQHPGPGGDLPSNRPCICLLPPVSLPCCLAIACCCPSLLSCLHTSPTLRVSVGKCQVQRCPSADEETEACTGEIMSPSHLLSKRQSQNGNSAKGSDFIASPETWEGRDVGPWDSG